MAKAISTAFSRILARIGLGDGHEFGLTWDDCYEFLRRLGYHVKVELAEA